MANPDKLPSNVVDISERLNKDEQLQQKLTTAIDHLKNNPVWKEKVVEGYWMGRLTENDRKELYKAGEPGLKNVAKKNIENLIKPFAQLLGKKKYDTRELNMLGNQVSGAARMLVQFGLLPAEGISQEELSQDIIEDEKSMKRLMTALRVFVTIVQPECAAELGEIQKTVNELIEAKKKLAEKQQGQQEAA